MTETGGLPDRLARARPAVPARAAAGASAGLGLSARGSACRRASASVLAVAVVIGLAASLRRGGVMPPAPATDAATVTLLSGAFLRVVGANLQVVLGLLLGALLFGAPTVLILVFNGFRLGWDAATMARHATGDLATMLLYVPLEYAGFVQAAAAGLQLGGRWFACLFELPIADGPPSTVRLAVLACGLVVAGAAVEAAVLCWLTAGSSLPAG